MRSERTPRPARTVGGWLALLTACLLVMVACGNAGAWRFIAGVAVLVAPGWVLASIGLDRERGGAHVAVGALGFSMALIVLATLTLDRIPARLHAVAVAVGVATTVSSILLARPAWRHRTRIVRPGWSMPIRFRHAALLATAFSVLNVAIAIARHDATYANDNGTSLLWMVPGSSGNGEQLDLGIQNYGQRPQTFMLTLLENENAIGTWDGIVVPPGKTWRQTVPIPADQASGFTIEARLHLSDHPNDVYRRVFVTQHP